MDGMRKFGYDIWKDGEIKKGSSHSSFVDWDFYIKKIKGDIMNLSKALLEKEEIDKLKEDGWRVTYNKKNGSVTLTKFAPSYIASLEGNKRHWIICSCGQHAICIERDSDGLIDMGFWCAYMSQAERGLGERIKDAFKLLFRKELFNDMVMLDDEEKDKLIEVLKKI